MAYGYVGDSTPDENSLLGIGAFDDTPGSLVGDYSAALKRSGAAEMGLAPGDTFEHDGRTYRYDDVIPEWSPVSKDYVDVYEPDHPADPNVGPDELYRQQQIFNRVADRRSSQEQAKEEVGLSDEQIREKYGSYLPDYKDSGQSAEPVSQEQGKPTDKPSTITPLETLKQQWPGLADDQLIGKLSYIFPDVPVDKLAVYAKQPGGGKLIADELTRGLTPLEKFKKLYPDKVGTKTDDQLIDYLHEHLEPNTPKDLFKDKVNPPSGVINDFKNALMAGWFQTSAKWEQFPKATADVLDNLYQAAGVYGWEKDASAWLAKSVPGYAAADDYFRAFVNYLNDGAQKFEKKADQARSQISPGIVGQATGVVGEVIGSTPDIAVSYGLGSIGRAAALFGMGYEGISAYGHAIENHQKNALGQGGQAASFRGFSQFLMNTGSGRVAAGIANSIATVANEEVEKWLRGEPNDITKDLPAATVGLLTGVLMGGKKSEGTPIPTEQGTGPIPKKYQKTFSEPLEFTPEQLKGEEVVQPSGKPVTSSDVLGDEHGLEMTWHNQPPIQTRVHTGSFTPEQMAQAAGRMPSRGTPEQMSKAAGGFGNVAVLSDPDAGLKEFTFKYSPPVNEELNKALEQKENGNHDQAAEHIDRAMALMNGDEQKDVVEKFKAKVDELGGNERIKSAATRYKGKTYTAATHAQITEQIKEETGEEDEASGELGFMTSKGRFVDREEALRIAKSKDQFAVGKDKPWYRASQFVGLHSDELKKESDDPFNDYYFSGMVMPLKSIREITAQLYKSTGMDWAGRKLRALASPERISDVSEGFGAIVKGEEARSKRNQATIPAMIARAHKVLEKLKEGDRTEVRERFFNKFNENQRNQMFMDYQEGRPIKDPLANWIWQNIYRPLNDLLDKRDKFYGIDYETRLNYMKQLFPNRKDDQFFLIDDVGRHPGGGPSFTKKRLMTYREHIERGDKPITSNPERVMMMRWRESELAIQKIRALRQEEAIGYAYNSKREDIPPGFKEGGDYQWARIRTANGDSYYVHNDIVPILNNKYQNRFDWYKTAAAPYFHTMRWLKGGITSLLSWSAFHPEHIADDTSASVSANAYMRRQQGVGTQEDALNEALDKLPWVGGGVQVGKAAIKYRDAVNFLKGRVDWDDLDEDMHRDINAFTDAGLTVGVSHERQMQFTEGMAQSLPKWIREAHDGHFISMGARALGMVWDKGTNGPFNKWWFGEITPRLKFSDFIGRRDTLMRARPELFKASNRMELLKEYQKIHRDIEARYGEMDYDNLLWPQWLKQVGQIHTLSLGWQIGAVRSIGDGVIDLTTNLAHWDEITAKSNNLKEWERNMVTNRMAYTAGYAARGALTGLAMAYLVGRVTPNIWDAFYPRVGKNDDGTDKRVNMQFFTKDIPVINEYIKQEGSLAGGLIRFGKNKGNPMAMTILQAITNRDYMDRPIGELPDRILYVLKQDAPISFQSALAASHGNLWAMPGEITRHPGDAIMDILGYTPSARWTMRTSTENEIMQRAYHPGHQKISDAREKYRQAYLSKDEAGMKEGEKELKSLKATDKQIKAIQKDAHLSTVEKGWKRLSKADKEDMLKKMAPDERRKWLKLSSKPVNEDMRHAGSLPK